MNRIYDNRGLIVAICSVSIVVLFFMPWIKVHHGPAAEIRGLFGGERSAAVLTSSGAGIPRLANGPLGKTFVQVFGMFFKSVTNADRKSYLVWLVPIIAAAMMLLSLKFKGKRMVSVILGLLCAVIVAAVIWKVLAANLDGLVFRVQICWAFWAILLAFVVTGAVHFMSLPEEGRKDGGDSA